MKQSQFRKNFPRGVEIPFLLKMLLEYQNRVDDSYSGYFWLIDNGQTAAAGYFDGDEKTASQFIFFGRNPDDSHYGFWLYEGRALGTAPIVYLGSEGTGCAVLANTLEEFLALLAVGADELGRSYGEEPEEPSKSLFDFRRWLKTVCGINKPRNADSIVAKAQKKHPDLRGWLKNWQESRFGGSSSKPLSQSTKLVSGPEKREKEDITRLLGMHFETIKTDPYILSLGARPSVTKSGDSYHLCDKKAGIECGASSERHVLQVCLYRDGLKWTPLSRPKNGIPSLHFAPASPT